LFNTIKCTNKTEYSYLQQKKQELNQNVNNLHSNNSNNYSNVIQNQKEIVLKEEVIETFDKQTNIQKVLSWREDPTKAKGGSFFKVYEMEVPSNYIFSIISLLTYFIYLLIKITYPLVECTKKQKMLTNLL